MDITSQTGYVTQSVVTSSHKGNLNQNVDNTAPEVKLPSINLQRFNGNYMQWLDFKEAFVGLLHNNPTLSDYQKFVYLKTSVEGDAGKPSPT